MIVPEKPPNLSIADSSLPYVSGSILDGSGLARAAVEKGRVRERERGNKEHISASTKAISPPPRTQI